MQPDALDQLLSGEGSISPSPHFAADVMRAVQREAATPRSIGFPWKPVAFGVASAALSLAAGVVMGTATAPPASALHLNVGTELLTAWAAHVAAGAENPAVSALLLAAAIALVPLAVYRSYQRMGDWS